MKGGGGRLAPFFIEGKFRRGGAVRRVGAGEEPQMWRRSGEASPGCTLPEWVERQMLEGVGDVDAGRSSQAYASRGIRCVAGRRQLHHERSEPNVSPRVSLYASQLFQMRDAVPELLVQHMHAAQVVAHRVFLGHPDAPVQLDR